MSHVDADYMTSENMFLFATVTLRVVVIDYLFFSD